MEGRKEGTSINELTQEQGRKRRCCNRRSLLPHGCAHNYVTPSTMAMAPVTSTACHGPWVMGAPAAFAVAVSHKRSHDYMAKPICNDLVVWSSGQNQHSLPPLHHNSLLLLFKPFHD